MKPKFSKNNLHNFLKIFLFLGIITIIAYLLPNQDTFKYQFETGKPWSYDLITSSFDFPIYKSETQIQQEKRNILQNFVPYYKLDTTVLHEQYNRLKKDYYEKHGEEPKYEKILWNTFKSIYQKGIVSAEQHQKIQEETTSQINCILPNKVIHIVSTDDIFSPKTAYQEMMKLVPPSFSSYNINLYLVENLKYDSVISDLSKKELLKNLSLTSGIIQAGERIIDRGEIVNEELYLILNSMKIEYDKRKASFQRSTLVLIGEIIVITGLIVLFFLYLHLFRPRIFNNLNNLLFINLMILIMIALASVVIQFTSVSYYIIPFALLPIIIRVFFDSRTALFAHIIMIAIVSLMVDNPFQFLLIQIAIGMTAVSSLKDMTQRSQLAQTALIILIAYILIYLALEFIREGELQRVNWQPLIYFTISSAFLLFAYLLIYIFEKIFGLISAVTLLELTNINSDLMMKFAEKAPGTFQHTLQVSNLATEAAKKIGANSLLVRTGALYHDIGKMKHPEFFIENQFGGNNPLSELDFEVAAKTIIGHVYDGIDIAKKEHLPEQIIHFINTHHGLSKTRYFYNSFINAHPNVLPDDSLYTYPGPLPDTKETAILMMADGVEARARSLKDYTEKSINFCVEDMINSQIADGQFKDAPISFRDVETVKAVFKEKIMNMYHTRIAYPEIK
ncbi:MAG: HDIG domain-containing protein [Paludibacter sp.]|nr:HDIG domain-containing protein [Paludibacter sp.]MDD4199362.1 HDIG domain-containing protein [Paludibacter sp.]MDD4428808.1 HDIG domain-containing protein [Paludibacter sp.]